MGNRFKRLLAQLNLANQLTFLRLVLIPFFVIAVLEGRFGVALGLFLAAAVTDLLDGLSARMLGAGTPLGAYLDPAADKLLLVAAFVLLTEYPVMLRDVPMEHRIPLWLTVLTISRDVLIVAVASLLYVTRTQTRFPPSIWGKLTTTVEFVLVALFLLFNQLQTGGRVLRFMVWWTLGMILLSGFHYLGKTIRMLSQPKPDP
jgi:cardiolipin synthase